MLDHSNYILILAIVLRPLCPLWCPNNDCFLSGQWPLASKQSLLAWKSREDKQWNQSFLARNPRLVPEWLDAIECYDSWSVQDNGQFWLKIRANSRDLELVTPAEDNSRDLLTKSPTISREHVPADVVISPSATDNMHHHISDSCTCVAVFTSSHKNITSFFNCKDMIMYKKVLWQSLQQQIPYYTSSPQENLL